MGRSFDNWARPVLVAGWLVWAAGCAAPAKTAPAQAAPAPAAQPQSASDKRFIIAPELEKVVHVVSVGLTHPPGGFLKIQVNVKNMTEVTQRFRYRIEWFDQDGAALPLAGGTFTSWMLMPHELSAVAVTAPTPAAADFGIAFVPEVK